jgi:hypothetical protein
MTFRAKARICELVINFLYSRFNCIQYGQLVIYRRRNYLVSLDFCLTVYQSITLVNFQLDAQNTLFIYEYNTFIKILCQSHWPSGLRRRSAAARLLRFWVRIPPGAWMSVCVSVVFCQVGVSATS